MTHTHSPDTRAFLRRLYAAPAQAFTLHARDKAGLDAWAAVARPALRDLIGLNRIRRELGSFSPTVRLSKPERMDACTRRKGLLLAEPRVKIPFWYLKPHGPGPHPLALFPHGHYGANGLDYAAGIAATPEARRMIADEDRDVAVQAVRRGFAAIAPATRGFHPVQIPDITSRHGSSGCRSHLMHALLAGRTVIGERVWDLERLIDWAVAQPDIDGSRILMMGNSGGGVATLYAAACDRRVTTAVVSCSFCTFVSRQGVLHHCDCNTVPGILRFGDADTVAGLIAPRRLLIVHGRADPLFAPAEIRRAVAGVRRAFAAAGARDAFRHAWGPGSHRFYSDLMWPFVTRAPDAQRA